MSIELLLDLMAFYGIDSDSPDSSELQIETLCPKCHKKINALIITGNGLGLSTIDCPNCAQDLPDNNVVTVWEITPKC